MPRLSYHLPRVGALALAAVVAAVAYSVHESKLTGSSPEPAPRVSAQALDLGGSAVSPVSKPEKSTDGGTPSSAPGAAPDSASLPTPSARSQAQFGPAESQLVAFAPLRAPRRGVVPPHPGTRPPDPGTRPPDPGTRPPQPGGGHRDLNNRSIDRELRRLIDDQPAPRRPQRPPARNEELPGDLEPVADTPVDGAPAVSPSAGAPDPGAVADPDAGLDDTALGGLDETDLGEPVDETDNATTDVPAPLAPAPAPEAPPAAPPAAAPPAAPPATPPVAAPPPAPEAPPAAPPAAVPPPVSTAPG
jgi:hypothetical protein